MKTIELSYDEAKELLERAVQEKGPDYVYVGPEGNKAGELGVSCIYFIDEETPGCIIGQVLAYKGFTRSDLNTDWAGLPSLNSGSGVLSLRNHEVLQVDDRTFRLMRETQQQQDRGVPWGLAVSHALRYTEEVEA